MRHAYSGAMIFDGHALRPGVVLVEAGIVSDIALSVPRGAVEVRLEGGILAPGLVDLQVNGGGGVMVDGSIDAVGLRRLCDHHFSLGATSILPTLITDRPEAVGAVIAAGIAARGAPGFLGLHLEGPHLDPRRKGAHDPALIRPMTGRDLDQLLQAARDLPALMVTLAPSAATTDQIAALANAGVVVSLGHSDCTAAEACAAIAAGAKCATHLFNAMSQIGNREPGLAGTVLTSDLATGLIADGIHVDPAVMKIALAAKTDGVFLVSDCMAAAGSDMTEFHLGGRRILRKDGRLTLEDGTLAGADVTLPASVRILTEKVGLSLPRALAMASRIPARVIGRPDLGRLAPGLPADMIHLGADLSLKSVWKSGEKRL